jgi:succinate dehydrogenase / fumarate reductase flavoprotein subunit
MLDVARVIVKGALQRDECRGAHYKPECQIPSPDADDPEKLHEQARKWCLAFKERNDRWLKTTIAKYTPGGPDLSYEEVDLSLIPPRPRTYGLKGAEIIEKVWKEMQGRERAFGKPTNAVAAGTSR